MGTNKSYFHRSLSACSMLYSFVVWLHKLLFVIDYSLSLEDYKEVEDSKMKQQHLCQELSFFYSVVYPTHKVTS